MFYDDIFENLDIFSRCEKNILENVQTDDEKLVLEIAVPGFNEDEINIELIDKILSIKGKKENNEKIKYKKQEIPTEIKIAYEINKDIFSLENIEANLDNGILKIKIPKQKEKKKEIKIKKLPKGED